MAQAVTHLPLFLCAGEPVYVQTNASPSIIILQGEYIMYLSIAEGIFKMVCASIMGVMLLLLFIANHLLLKKNRQFLQTIRNKNKYCRDNHVEVPF